MPAKQKLVTVVVEFASAYGRGVAQGAMRYGRLLGPWQVAIRSHWAAGRDPAVIAADGVIIEATAPRMAEVAAENGRPAVNVCDVAERSVLPMVVNDNLAIGRIAAEHLLDCGLAHFGFVGDDRNWYARQRFEGLSQRVTEAGRSVAVCWLSPPDARPPDAMSPEEIVADWLRQTARPIGVLAQNDSAANLVMRAAEHAHLRVPDDVAIIGVDNDELICGSAPVRLSSVASAAERIGFEAARLLDAMFDGRTPPTERIEIEPAGLIVRESTDTLAVEDPVVAQAVAFIRQRADGDLTVDDILDNVAVSRRQLELRFKAALGRSPAREIRRTRMVRARALIDTTELPLGDIAHRCGFQDLSAFGRCFRRETGMSPTQYRTRTRLR